MAQFGLKFGTGPLSATSGLAPTFTNFARLDTAATLAPPGITQIYAGVGIYSFEYTPSLPIYFQVDGATTGLGSFRYIHGMLANLDQLDVLLAQQGGTLQAIGATILQGQVNLGSTLVAIGNTLGGLGGTLAVGMTSLLAAIGSTASVIGDNASNPATLYGYLKRLQNFNEGDSDYDKASGVWTITGVGGDTTLAVKTLNESSTNVTKT